MWVFVSGCCPCTQVAEEVFAITGRDPMIEVAQALQEAALGDDYFVSR